MVEQRGDEEGENDSAESSQKKEAKLLGALDFGMTHIKVGLGKKPGVGRGQEEETTQVIKSPPPEEGKPFKSGASYCDLKYAK